MTSLLKCFQPVRHYSSGFSWILKVGKLVVLEGWVHRIRLDRFILLRRDGDIIQLNCMNLPIKDFDLNAEDVIKVSGTVQLRPPGQENKSMKTGRFEVAIDSLAVLNKRQGDLPFEVNAEFKSVAESQRLRFRYLEMRRLGSNSLLESIRQRCRLWSALRRCLESMDFVEVETPLLSKRSQGGASEFLVPSSLDRHAAPMVYALPQSPQVYKQLLMAAGISRYYQIARCLREEPLRMNRQLEFTQLDLEMAFTHERTVERVVEKVLAQALCSVFGRTLPTPFYRITFDDAIRLYGTDKPDLRFGLTLSPCQPAASPTTCSLSAGQFSRFLSKATLLKLLTRAHADTAIPQETTVLCLKRTGSSTWRPLLLASCQGVTELASRAASELTNGWQLPADSEPAAGDVLFLARCTSAPSSAAKALGQIRLLVAAELDDLAEAADNGWPKRRPDDLQFVWVEQFPLFEPAKNKADQVVSAHHVFTAPLERHVDALLQCPPDAKASALLGFRSRSYDLVLNGLEIGGGSIRIHEAGLQRHVLQLKATALHRHESDFDELMTALEYGCPPHGGIALGLDRLLAVLLQKASIRDVIPFPKLGSGVCPLLNAPTKFPGELSMKKTE